MHAHCRSFKVLALVRLSANVDAERQRRAGQLSKGRMGGFLSRGTLND